MFKIARPTRRRLWLLTQTHWAALAVYKWGTGTGHWGACYLVTHDLGLLSINEYQTLQYIAGIHNILVYMFVAVHYLAGAFGAAVHNPVFFIIKQAAILPAHIFLFRVLHPAKGLLHDCVFLCLKKQQTDLEEVSQKNFSFWETTIIID